jgi:hypothetical protein
MTRDSSLTRRRFLLAAGATAAVAGCSETTPFSEEPPERISLHQLPEVPEDSEPVVVDDLPVDIESGKLRRARTRVTDLLETVPIPFGPEAVPNGYVRGELVEAAENATGHLDRARSSSTRLSALRSLHHARTEARYAAEGWAFVERDRTEEELRAERRETVTEGREFRSAYEYLGDDPVRAVVVHAAVNRNLQRVLDARRHSLSRDSGPLLTVAEWGEAAESVRTDLGDGRYLYERFSASLPPDVGTIEPTLNAAADSLTAELERRRDELPSEPTDSDGELAGRIRSRLRGRADSGARNVSDAGGPARTVLAATETLTDFLAYDRIDSRIKDGERFAAETGEDVRAARSAAIEAIQRALAESVRPTLVRGILADAARQVSYADTELSRYRRSVRPSRLNDSLRRYAAATARARSVPTVCQQVVETLEA